METTTFKRQDFEETAKYLRKLIRRDAKRVNAAVVIGKGWHINVQPNGQVFLHVWYSIDGQRETRNCAM